MNRPLVFLAGAGSLAVLLAAFGFQYLGDLPPCKMCIWQRWPHGLAIVAAGLALGLTQGQIPGQQPGLDGRLTGGRLRLGRLFASLGALAALTTSGIGFYHAGVEQKFWEGPSSCTSSGALTQTLDELMNAPLVRCDEIPWELFSISMAGWNGIVSLGLFGLWVLALRRKTH